MLYLKVLVSIVLLTFSSFSLEPLNEDYIVEVPIGFNMDEDTALDEEGYSKLQLLKKMNEFTTLREKGGRFIAFGTSIIAVGVLSTTIGTFIVDGGESNSSDGFGAGMIITGIVSINTGFPLLISGIVRSAIGGPKSREYEQRYKNFSLRYNPEERAIGLSLDMNLIKKDNTK